VLRAGLDDERAVGPDERQQDHARREPEHAGDDRRFCQRVTLEHRGEPRAGLRAVVELDVGTTGPRTRQHRPHGVALALQRVQLVSERVVLVAGALGGGERCRAHGLGVLGLQPLAGRREPATRLLGLGALLLDGIGGLGEVAVEAPVSDGQ